MTAPDLISSNVDRLLSGVADAQVGLNRREHTAAGSWSRALAAAAVAVRAAVTGLERLVGHLLPGHISGAVPSVT